MKYMGDWAGLPVDLLDAIAKRLDSYGDYVRLRAVCMQWQSALPKKPTHQQLCQLPWLILPYDDESETLRSFFSLLEKKVYHFELLEARGKLFRGSSFGWLVTVERGPALHLFNPFTKAQIDLPPISTFPNVKEYRADRRGQEYAIVQPGGTIGYLDKYHIQENFVEKVILSSSPTSSIDNDYMAMAIYGGFCELAFCRCGDKKWTAIPTSQNCYTDIIYHEEKLYALTDNAKLVVCDMGLTPKGVKVSVKPPPLSTGSKVYLVAACGELMMIERCCDMRDVKHPELPVCHYKTTGFNIYKLDLSKRRPKWSKLNSLGDQVLLLGYNSSSSFSPQNFPNCKGNCIYYTDDMSDYHHRGTIGGYDIGVFNLENKTIKGLVGYKGDPKMVWPIPVWVLPHLS